MEQLIEHTILTKTNAPVTTAVRNFLAKGFIKKELNSRLVKHVNKPIKNVHLYVRVSTYIASTVSRSAHIVKITAIAITSNNTLKAPKINLTIFISKGGV